MEGQLVARDRLIQPALQRLGQGVEMRICLGVEDLEQGHPCGGHRQRIAVEGPHLRHALLLDHAHDVLAAADGAARQTAADRLGQSDQVGRHLEALSRAAGSDGDACFHLVEDEQRAVAVGDLFDLAEEALVREDDADVHHRRLDDHRRDLVLVPRECLLQGGQVVERDDGGELDDRGRDALALREGVGIVGRAHVFRRGLDRHHQRVVMAVVRRLDLDHAVTPGEPAGNAHRVERRLGARVGEAPFGLMKAARELAGDDHGILDRLGEVRAAADLGADRVDDLGVGVADDHHAKTVVEVHVLVAVDVPDPAALSVLDEDRVRRRVLEGRRYSPREHLPRLRPQLVRARTRLAEALFLGLDQVGDPAGGDFALTGGSLGNLIVAIFSHPSD